MIISGTTIGGATLRGLASAAPAPDVLPGALWVAGWNAQYGQLGTGDRINRSSPVQTVAGGSNWQVISAGQSNTGGIKSDGTLWMWGSNFNGQLGTNDLTHRSSPIQTVAAGTNWSKLKVARDHTAAIKTDGTLWLWGLNTYGGLGTNNVVHRSSPVQTVSGGSNWKEVAVGNECTGAIKTDGTLWTWGKNNDGALGSNTQGISTRRSSPAQTVAGGSNWNTITAGDTNMGAIKTDGTLWLWGRNQYGQMGDNTIANKSSPVQTIARGSNWSQINIAFIGYVAAIKTDGTLWMWGRNTEGWCGVNDRNNRSSPVQTVAGGTNWKSTYNQTGFQTAIKTDGTLWAWGGDNTSFGGFGNGTRTPASYSSPVQVFGFVGANGWQSATSGGGSNIYAIRAA